MKAEEGALELANERKDIRTKNNVMFVRITKYCELELEYTRRLINKN